MQFVILIIFGIIWLIGSGISNLNSNNKRWVSFEEKRDEKYKDRTIDLLKSLFDRNKDIIEIFEKKITTDPPQTSYYRRHYSHQDYYIENIIRDCVNEICLAENEHSIWPDSQYLSDWITTAPSKWIALANQIEKVFRDKQKQLKDQEEVVRTK